MSNNLYYCFSIDNMNSIHDTPKFENKYFRYPKK